VTRPSPQTDRVVAVVELLMSRPAEGLTLSEISRRLRVNTPSCHFMLTALTGHGWLVRHPTRKTYRLGPALVAAGKAAGAGFPGAEYAHPGMVALAESLGVSCLAFAVADDQLTLVDHVWDPHSAARILHVGYRLPLRAPTGAVFVAWSAREAVARWLGDDDPADGGDGADGADGARAERFRRTLAFVRARGYGVELLPNRLGGAVREAVDRGGTRAAEAVLREFVREMETVGGDLDPDARYEVSSISAPVFGVHGEVILAVAATGWRERLPGAAVEQVGRAVRAAADDVTASLGGRQLAPGPRPPA
jgi:DNA-binding IclR family transcriptional regulator